MKNLVNRIIKEENGQGMTEYGMVLGFIAVAAIAVMAVFKTEITALFNDATGELRTDFDDAPVTPEG